MVKRYIHGQEKLTQSVLNDPEMHSEYESFKLQLEFAEKMKSLREHAHLTQSQIAEKMHTTKSTIARLEAAGGKGKHSPTLKTLVKCAGVLGYKIELKLKPLV